MVLSRLSFSSLKAQARTTETAARTVPIATVNRNPSMKSAGERSDISAPGTPEPMENRPE
ncbi:MAG: hypothetical protein J6Z16_01385 [Candidatus Methanomethylophilaceae archaeon]|nr:hypothetical protein [Candidatus Methanomethylophilaceae archaeon]